MGEFMKFISKKTKISIEPYLALISKFSKDEKYVDFFTAFNVATPIEDSCIFVDDRALSIDFFLGRSTNGEEDLLKVFQSYENRIPSAYLPVCQANDIDFLCVGVDSGVYLWSREKNDLYFDPKNANFYLPQNIVLRKCFEGFDDLLDSIVRDDSNVIGGIEDDYDNPNIPFDDDDIEDDFKHPELFFKQSPDAVRIQLKKLNLSKRGCELLELFRDMGLV